MPAHVPMARRIPDGEEVPLAWVLRHAPGRWLSTTPLAQALRDIGDVAAELVVRMHGRADRLGVRGRAGATVRDHAGWSAESVGDLGPLDVASHGLALAFGVEPADTLGGTLAKCLPLRAAGTFEGACWARMAMPPPLVRDWGPSVATADGVDPQPWLDLLLSGAPSAHAVAGRAEAWSRAFDLPDRGEPRRLPVGAPELELEHLVQLMMRCGHTAEEAESLAAVMRDRETGRRAGPVHYQGRLVYSIDLSAAYANVLSSIDLPKIAGPIYGWDHAMPLESVAWTVPGLPPAEGVVKAAGYPWTVVAGWPRAAEEWERAQAEGARRPGRHVWVQTSPGRTLTATVRRILAVCLSEGGRPAYKTAGRILFGHLYGSLEQVSWCKLKSMPPGAYEILAGRAVRSLPRGIQPWAEPAAAGAVIDAVAAEAAAMAGYARTQGEQVLAIDTDGMVLVGEGPGDWMAQRLRVEANAWNAPPTQARSVSVAPPWADWRVKWQGRGLSWLAPRHYAGDGCGVVFSGLQRGSPAAWRMKIALEKAVATLPLDTPDPTQ